MHNELVVRWFAALWSGKYNKMTGALANADRTRFCAKGVAADHLVRNGEGRWSSKGSAASFVVDHPMSSEHKKLASEYSIPDPLRQKFYLNAQVEIEKVREILDHYGVSEVDHTFFRNPHSKKQVPIHMLVMQLNDEIDRLSFGEIGDILYEIYTSLLGLDLPSKSSIQELIDDDDDEEEEESDNSPKREPVPA